MTTTEDRPVVDLDAASLAVIVEAVVAAGYGSQKLVQRKLRLAWAECPDVLDELAGLGVLGEPDAEGTWSTLVDAAGAAAILARLADPGEPDDEPVPGEPLVSLVKPATTLAVRPDDDLEVRPPGDLVWPEHHVDPASRQVQVLVTRARQAAARGLVTVVDQPVVVRGVAVTRQAPRAGVRLVAWTPRGAVRGAALSREWLFATRSQAMVGRLADQDHPDWHKSAAELAKLHERLATRRLVVGAGAGVAVLAALAWWAPPVFAGLLAVVVGAGVLALARPVCREPKELAVCALVALGLGWVTWSYGPDLAGVIPRPPGWAWLALAGVAVAGLGWLGRKEDQTLVDLPATMAPHKPPIVTAPMVIEALCSLGHSKMKDPDDIRVIMDPHQAGAGVQIDLEMPKGVPASYVVKNREPLAASMRHPLGCIWPAVGVRHPGHLSLYISEQVMAEAFQKPWPLATGSAVDIFQPQPQVTNQRGDWVDLVLAYASVVIGAQPRMGKTFFLRQLLLVAGLDVRTKVASLDGKGTGDLAATRPFAHFYSVGDDPEEIEGRVLTFLRDVRADMRKRAKFIRDLPYEEAPESKVTSELVDQHPAVLAPWVIGIDETQSYFGYGEKKNKAHTAVRDEITAIVTDLVKRGPALGIWVILATQNVSEETIPRPISLNAVIRAALKLFDDSANNMVLGSGAYGKGVDATQFDFTDKGLMWLRGDGDRPFIGRSVVGLDAPAAERIAARARALRLAAGRLTGQAADDDAIDAEVVYDVVQDAEHVMSAHSCGKAQWGELVPWLREFRPGQYGDLTARELSAGVHAAGVRVRDIRSGDLVRKGVSISDLRGQESDDDD